MSNSDPGPRAFSFSASCSSRLRKGSFSSPGAVPVLPLVLNPPGLCTSPAPAGPGVPPFPCHAAGLENALVGRPPNMGSKDGPPELLWWLLLLLVVVVLVLWFGGGGGEDGPGPGVELGM